MSLLTLFDESDTIAIVRPGYPAYRNMINALSLNIFYIDTKLENNFQLTSNMIKLLPKNIKGIIISSPSNPCGSIVNNEEMKEIIEICRLKGIKVISDEIYHKVEFETKKLQTAFMLDRKSVVINSFSKYFLMTGYRLGWIVSDKEFIHKIRSIAMNFYLSPSSISQYVAQHVFNYYNYFDRVVLNYLDNRDLLINFMNKLGLKEYSIPKAAFYLYIDISKIHNDSYHFCKKMVEEIGVTVAPGKDFDNKEGSNFIRISYACKKNELIDALNLIKKWI